MSAGNFYVTGGTLREDLTDGLTRAIDFQTYRDIDDDLVTIAGGFDDLCKALDHASVQK